MKTVKTAVLLTVLLNSTNLKVKAQDPGSAVTLGVGAVLALELGKAVIQEGAKNFADYYYDYSKADFAVRDAFWSDGFGKLYGVEMYERYRMINWSLTGVASYQTEIQKHDIRDRDNTLRTEEPKYTAFDDWERARFQRKWYRMLDGKLVWEQTHLMRYKFRLKNSNYRSSKYMSKQLPSSLPATAFFRFTKVPMRTINGIDVDLVDGRYVPFTLDYKNYSRSIQVPVSDFSTVYDYPTNCQLDCETVPPLYCPGSNDDYVSNCLQ